MRRFGVGLLLLAVGLSIAAGSFFAVRFARDNSPLFGGAPPGDQTQELLAQGVPQSVIDDAQNCLGGDAATYHTRCRTYPVPSGTEFEVFRVEVAHMMGLGGEWRGNDPAFAIDGGSPIAVTSVGGSGWSTFSGDADMKEIRPWVELTLPAFDSDLEVR